MAMHRFMLIVQFLLLLNGCGALSEYSIQSLPETPVFSSGFAVKDDMLTDFTGNEFVIRGVNMPFAYYYEQSLSSLKEAKMHGFNTVRIVWCADNLLRSGRCDSKDMHSLNDLAKVLESLRELELVAVINLQNATGSDNPEHLSLLVDWYLRPDVKDLLNRFQDMLLINIANEWFGSWEDPSKIYVDTYTREIRRIRENGLNHVLIVDARGWGQQFQSIFEIFPRISLLDKNILYSAHMYDLFSSRELVKSSFEQANSYKIPLLIGEFGCTHYPGQSVACDAILEYAETNPVKYGHIAWSYSGNSGPLTQLDLFEAYDWKTLSKYGSFVINESPYSIKKTSQTACLFPGQVCPNELQ